MKDSDDPAIKAVQNRIITLANKSLDEAFDLLEYGTPQQKMMLITKFGGHMLRALGQQDDDGIEGLRRDFLQLVKETHGPVREPGEAPDDPNQGGWPRSA